MKHALNITTTLILCGSMAQAYAQSPAACIPTPSCTSLGYTSTTSCTDGLKCPFGNYWNCSISEIRTEITEIKNIIEQQEQENALKSCEIGHIFYSDKTCSVSPTSNKTPIGVVVYTDGQGHGQIIALKSIGSYIWGEKGIDISTITNSQNAQTASYELTSCINTAKIMTAGDKNKYPAAWAAYEYKTEGTNAGDWCLPAAGIFTSYFKNQIIINTGLTNAGGTPFTNALNAWTSTEMNSDNAWNSYLFMEYGLQSRRKNYSNEVRPVLEF